MEVRGRNRKWLGAWDRRTVRKVGLVIVLEFCARVRECSGKGGAFIVVNVVELSTQHEHVRGKYSSRSRRGSVNWEEGMDSRELVMDLFFLNIEEASNVLDHLLVG